MKLQPTTPIEVELIFSDSKQEYGTFKDPDYFYKGEDWSANLDIFIQVKRELEKGDYDTPDYWHDVSTMRSIEIKDICTDDEEGIYLTLKEKTRLLSELRDLLNIIN